jgi:hypothetical protein
MVGLDGALQQAAQQAGDVVHGHEAKHLNNTRLVKDKKLPGVLGLGRKPLPHYGHGHLEEGGGRGERRRRADEGSLELIGRRKRTAKIDAKEMVRGRGRERMGIEGEEERMRRDGEEREEEQ